EDVRYVIEPAALIIRRQQGGGINIRSQQVANGVRILRAVEPMRGRPSRFWIGCAGAIQTSFQKRPKGVQPRLVRTPKPRWRHHPCANLAVPLLPRFRAFRNVAEVSVFERKSSGSRLVTMARHAVTADYSLCGRLRALGSGSRLRATRFENKPRDGNAGQ